MSKRSLLYIVGCLLVHCCFAQRTVVTLNKDWFFHKGNMDTTQIVRWDKISIPHDWSILEAFDSSATTTYNQGSLPAGIGWYKKNIKLSSIYKNKNIRLVFDGVFQRCTIWLNGQIIKQHANGYVSFDVNIGSLLRYDQDNELLVKVDNSLQPNSRWYTGSGLYRKVWLDIQDQVHIPFNDVYITTKTLSVGNFELLVKGILKGKASNLLFSLNKKPIVGQLRFMAKDSFEWRAVVKQPKLWSPETPNRYALSIQVISDHQLKDEVDFWIGFRDIKFDAESGFHLNGNHYLIKGVCMHHDLGALGAAVYPAAIKRQLTILKEMGANAIRTAHNPPSVEMLNICDSMGFLVMDELYDMWAKKKNKYDQYQDFKANWKDDVEHWIKRDRNHPSIIAWSIGNEIREQFDSTGLRIARELALAVKAYDQTRPITSALTENLPDKNFIYQSGALDLLGFNYKPQDYPVLAKRFPGIPIVATETASAFASRGEYDFPADSMHVWPPDSKPFKGGREDHQVSAFDHVYAYWGTTHENAWLQVKKHTNLAGAFVWSGFDFIGEPIPYEWPSRSSYYGIMDLAGFPKDIFYMYQSEWTTKQVLHILPHWNWDNGQQLDVWAYAGAADEVELFINGKSVGKKTKHQDKLHFSWNVKYEPGSLKAVSYRKGVKLGEAKVHTAGSPHALQKHKVIRINNEDGSDLIFIELDVVDQKGDLVPNASKEVSITLKKGARLLAMDNGSAIDKTPFSAHKRFTYNGKLLIILQAQHADRLPIELECTANGIMPLHITFE